MGESKGTDGGDRVDVRQREADWLAMNGKRERRVKMRLEYIVGCKEGIYSLVKSRRLWDVKCEERMNVLEIDIIADSCGLVRRLARKVLHMPRPWHSWHFLMISE